MGIEFKLTDRELPASRAFIDFVSQQLAGRSAGGESWADQCSEGLMSSEQDVPAAVTPAAAVMGSACGRDLVTRAYSLFLALLLGELTSLTDLQSRFHFVTVIGIPRTGGSYLTAELYRAVGMNPQHVPHTLAHDSFPELGPFELAPGMNSWTASLKTFAEYLTMVESFFGDRQPHAGKIVVPKKFTQAGYAGNLMHRVLGANTETILTVRHPVAACVSTYEKSGGLPEDGCFAVRSNIEGWCRRDLQQTGLSAEHLNSLDYFDAYLRYWEGFHLSLATTGISAMHNLRSVAFGQSALQALAQSYHARYHSGFQVGDFHVSDKAQHRHPQWMKRARPSIDRIAAVWKSVGIPYPADEISHCW